MSLAITIFVNLKTLTMSETVHYKGKAMKIAQGEKAEIKAKNICRVREVKKSWDTYIESLCDWLYEEYFYHDKTETLYSVSYTEHDLDEEIITAKETDIPDEIEFELRFYNGGAGFSECLEEAMDKLEK